MSQELMLDPNIKSAKQIAFWLYIIHGAALFLGMFLLSWVPLIAAYVKRGDARGTFIYTHYTWQIRMFWWSLVLGVIGAILFITVLGIPIAWAIWGITWLWAVYRIVKGVLNLNDNIPVGNYHVF